MEVFRQFDARLLCDFAFKAERVFSLKIEFNRKNRVEVIENQQ